MIDSSVFYYNAVLQRGIAQSPVGSKL